MPTWPKVMYMIVHSNSFTINDCSLMVLLLNNIHCHIYTVNDYGLRYLYS
jgi:hypothetical protein